MSNGLVPDEDLHFVGPDLDQTCWHRLSADEKKSPLAGKELRQLVHSARL